MELVTIACFILCLLVSMHKSSSVVAILGSVDFSHHPKSLEQTEYGALDVSVKTKSRCLDFQPK